jgi:hypothetical protein
VPFKLVLNPVAIHALFANPAGEVTRSMFARGKLVEANAQRLCPVRTGRLRASIGTTVVPRGVVNVIRVGSSLSYARDVHDGTGIYGPSGQRIHPVSGGYMSWQPRGGGDRVYVRSTAGMPGTPYLTDSLPLAVA